MDAPPTKPGALDSFAHLPMSRLALWSLICGVVGLLISPAALVAIPLGIVALVRLNTPPRRQKGLGLAIGGLATGVVGLFLAAVYAMTVVSTMRAVANMDATRTNMAIAMLHEHARTYATTQGHYPDHVVEVAIRPRIASRIVRLMTNEDGPAIMVGPYDFRDFDGSDAAIQTVRDAVAAMEVSASEPWYRFGEIWFVRLPAPTGQTDVVFAWTYHPGSDRITVVGDTGSYRSYTPDEWPLLWKRDAEARRSANLPAIPTPPAPN